MHERVHFIIPSFEGEDTIKPCLDSILNQDYPKDLLWIHVIENGPKTNLESLVSEYPHCTYYYNPVTGRSEARNFILHKIDSELIAFVDVDVVLSDTWLKGCLKEMKSPFCAAVTGPVIRKGNRWIDKIRRISSDLSTNGQANTMENPVTLGCMNTAAVLMRSTALKFVGNFDTNFLRSEDLELTHRFLRSGFIIATSSLALAEVHWNRSYFEYFFLRTIESGYFTAKALCHHQASVHRKLRRKIYLNPFLIIMNSCFWLGFTYGKWKYKNLKSWVPQIYPKRVYSFLGSLPFSCFELNPLWEIIIVRNSVRFHNRQLGKMFSLHPKAEKIIQDMLETSFYYASGPDCKAMLSQLIKDKILLDANN